MNPKYDVRDARTGCERWGVRMSLVHSSVRMAYSYRPLWVTNAVLGTSASATLMQWYADFASNLEKKQQPDRKCRILSLPPSCLLGIVPKGTYHSGRALLTSYIVERWQALMFRQQRRTKIPCAGSNARCGPLRCMRGNEWVPSGELM